MYKIAEWFDRTVDALAALYDLGLDDEGQRFSYETRIRPDDWRPLLWLGILGRVCAVGALAVRTRKWAAVRSLAETRPTLLHDYYGGWLRHGLTMASRASLLQEDQEGEQRQLSLLSVAARHIERSACLKLDRDLLDDDAALTSLVQFDVLANLVSIDSARSVQGSVFYPSFAPFSSHRSEPIIARLIRDEEMRKIVFPLSDADLAFAVGAMSERATSEGFGFSGFHGFDTSEIRDFLDAHYPTEPGDTVLQPD